MKFLYTILAALMLSMPLISTAQTGTITARVWNDKDGDGVQDNNENSANISGVTVQLLNPANTVITSAPTASNGTVTFNNVAAGNYKLKFSIPDDHKFTGRNKGGVEEKDSDAKGDGTTDQFSLADGQTVSNQDAGLWAPGTVIARVWNDKDGDGIQDNNENSSNISGVKVQVIETGGAPLTKPGGGTVMGTTGSNGTVSLYIPADRSVKLKFTNLPDHAITGRNKGGNESRDSDMKGDGTTDQFTVNRGSHTITNQDAGLWAPGTVTARVWNDKDGDGIQDNNENSSNISGVKVQVIETGGAPLTKPGGGTVMGTTGSNGTVSLYIPADRSVKLKFTNLPDHAITGRNKGGNESRDSDMKGDGTTDQFTVNRGSHTITNQDAGLWAPGTVTARVWNDKDGDGIQDNNENSSNISGVKVQVIETGGAPLTKPGGGTVMGTTGSNGTVSLYIPADRSVKLKFTNLPDHAITGRNKGGNESRDSDMKGDGTTDQFSVNRGNHTITNQDAGLWAPGTARARVWIDKDGDGIQDNNENGGLNNVFGMRVNLLETNGNPVLKNGKPVYGITDCGTGEAILDYVPADRSVKLQFVKFSGGVYTGRNKTSESKDSDAKGDGTTDSFKADRGSDSHTAYDAGLTTRGNFSDVNVIARVWNDKDGDGKQDDSNSNLANVKVNLLDKNNKLCYCETTNNNGIATIPAIGGKTYKLDFDLPKDHAFTTKDKGGVSDTQDSDADRNNGRTKTFNLSSGANVTNFDAGMWAPGTVQARVWNDKDGDGKQDDSNANVSGITVKLLESNNTVIKTAVTNNNGIATITGVPANRSVKLQFVDVAGIAFTTKDKGGVSDTQDSDADRNNGRTKTFSASKGSQVFTSWDAGVWLPGTVQARVWNDKDGDGKQDDSNANVSGITVKLLTASNTVIGSAMTNNNGIATITGVPADQSVKLEFEDKDGNAFTTKDKGGVSDTQDSDADRNNGRTKTFSASKGSQVFTSWDAGVWLPGTVQARVWNDKDGDGKQDDSNANVSGITVKLLTASNTVIGSAMTNNNGIATITGVPADQSVKLEFEDKDGNAFTTKDKGGVSDTQDSDADRNNGRTKTFSASKGSQVFTSWDAGVWLPGTVQARVWNDKDGDGKQDDSNANVQGVKVRLLTAANVELGSAMTNNNGIATIQGVPADQSVKLEFEAPVGIAFTTKDKGGVSDTQDSDADLNNGRTKTFSASKGSQVFTMWDAGLVPNVVANRAAEFGNGQGIQRATEPREMTLFPVPAISNLNVQFKHMKDELVQYMIIDLQGRVVANQPWRLIKGHNQMELNVNDFASGTYFFVIRGAQVMERKTFTVVRQ